MTVSNMKANLTITASVLQLWQEGQKSHRLCSFLQQRKSKSSHPAQEEWGKILHDDRKDYNSSSSISLSLNG